MQDVKPSPIQSDNVLSTLQHDGSEGSESRDPWRNESERPLFAFKNSTIKINNDANSFSLQSFKLEIYPGHFIGITGSAGSGKTTLIKALLNRLPNRSSQKLIHPEASVAYCAQTPWLPRGTIRDAIVGESQLDKKWYDNVLNACALEEDLQGLDAGDQTDIGSQGTNLSGGQRQRVVSQGSFGSLWLLYLSL